MKTERDITIVTGEDWQGLYINGVLVYEGHQIDIMTFCELVFDFWPRLIWCDDDWLEEQMCFPVKLEDVMV